MKHISSFQKFTAEACEKEPIHIPGSVQPHGILIALRSSDLTIQQISSNVFDHLGIHPDELLHQPLSQLMDLHPVEQATLKLGERMPRLLNPIPIIIEAHGRRRSYDGILHRSGRTIILELENHIPRNEGYGGFGGFYEAIREVATQLMSAHSLDEILTNGCVELRKLTSFSRVLAYKFDDDWNGAVVAESREPHMPSLLHHRFPSTDIPKQARDLYTTNWLRLIPDVDYVPSPIVPSLNPLTDKPLDLSNSVLRSVSPVHVEYMRNMGQAASMSISLLKDKKLWGLISCHHEKSNYLKFDTRVAAEFIGQMVSAQITAREDASEEDNPSHLRILLSAALSSRTGLSGAFDILKKYGNHLMGVADSRGVAVCSKTQCHTFGVVPQASDIKVLRNLLAKRNDRFFYTNEIRKFQEFSKEFISKAAGVMAILLPNGAQIIWFRPEVIEQIPWSGNPNLSKEKDPDGQLRPRKSFETWLENVEGKSLSWKEADISAVKLLNEALSGMPDEIVDSEKENSGAFRSALARSIENTHSTKESREPTVTEHPSNLQEASVNSRALLDGFAEFSVLFLSPVGEIQTWTLGATRLLGYTTTQAVGKRMDLFLSDDEIAKDKHSRILEYVAGHNRCEEEIWLYRADRSSFWGKIMVAAVRDEKESLIGYSVVIQDVTKEKAAEEELRATKVAAEAANRAKTAFLANISHEIRTPLGAVLGFAELLGATTISDEDRANLSDRIHRNGEQLTSLINDLLDLTKVEANKLDVELLEFDLSALLLDTSETLSIKASEKSIQLVFKVNGLVPRFIVSDPTRLRQILVNIISNAIKFTPEGGKVSVSVSQQNVDQQNKIHIHVSDTGRGMSEDQTKNLFKPFVQADVSTTRKFGGTGLGLFVSRRLARLLNGDVSIEESEIGKGSVFLISVDAGQPQSEKVFTALEPSTKTAPLNLLDNEELKNTKILVVDDSPDNRQLIQFYLMRAGAHVEVAENGREGIEKAFGGSFDVVLMDIQMPILDGNAAMRELKSSGYKKPVVALTAHAMSEEKDHSLSLGFSDYVTKPIQRDVLVRTIRELIKKMNSH